MLKTIEHLKIRYGDIFYIGFFYLLPAFITACYVVNGTKEWGKSEYLLLSVLTFVPGINWVIPLCELGVFMGKILHSIFS